MHMARIGSTTERAAGVTHRADYFFEYQNRTTVENIMAVLYNGTTVS
jgi:hypothetical protein